MDKFYDVLKKIDYKNYIVDYAHPMIMAQNARFVMAYTYSSVLFDAYFIGKPIVLYTQYDPKLYKLLGKKSEGGQACDYFIHRKPEKLDTVLNHLIHGEVKIKRDLSFIRKNFPETEELFWHSWKKIIETPGR